MQRAVGDPHVVVCIDAQAVGIGQRAVAPRAQQFAGGVEDEDLRCRHALEHVERAVIVKRRSRCLAS